jgi:hypothetical protein
MERIFISINLNYEKSDKSDIKVDLKYLYNYIAFLIFECSFYIQVIIFECNNECSSTNIEEFWQSHKNKKRLKIA